MRVKKTTWLCLLTILVLVAPGAVLAWSDCMPDKVAELRKQLHAWYRDVDAKFLQPKGDGPAPWHPGD